MGATGAVFGELRSRIHKMASYIRRPPPVLCPGGEVSHPVDGLMKISLFSGRFFT